VTDAPPMISYSQNLEDVVLQRALPTPVGFYVDVGAASPSIASVTRHFYDHGWSGINIEPLPEYAAELRLARPRDWTVQAVAGASHGQAGFHVVESDRDLSTFDPRRVEELSTQGVRTDERLVDMVTLNELLELAQPETIDFLKIDAEGTERDVLQGLDLRVWRPRVLLIEATFPNSQIPSYRMWEDLVLAGGYRFASFDGINRFYAAEEESSLIDRLAPANALDRFIPASVQLVHDELERIRSAYADVERQVTVMGDELQRVRSAYALVEREMALKDEEMATTAEYVRHLEQTLEIKD
jgi:FkbM family methyltransferase